MSFEAFDHYVLKPFKQNNPTGSLAQLMPEIRKNFGIDSLSPYESELLENAFNASMKGVGEDEESYLLYGGYEPISVTLTHILNNRAGLAWASYSHTGVPVATFALGVGENFLTDTTTIRRYSGKPQLSWVSASRFWQAASYCSEKRCKKVEPGPFLRGPGAVIKEATMIIKERMEIRDFILTAVLALVTLSLFFIPTRFGSPSDLNTARVRAEILEVDNSTLEKYGIVTTGDQGLTMRIASGQFKGEIIQGANMLIGKMEMDKLFVPGDYALVTLSLNEARDTVISNQGCRPLPHTGRTCASPAVYCPADCLRRMDRVQGGGLLYFYRRGYMENPDSGFLVGIPPVLLSLIIVSAMTGVIIFLIGGISRMGLVAFLGAISGVGTTALLSLVFGSAFRIHGAVKPFAETLLYSGYPHLNLTSIFLAGIFIASSGAVMDIAMDIAASMREVQEKHPGIGRKDLIISGLRVGRAVVGTMTTTLLLAYSGDTPLFSWFSWPREHR